MTQYLFDFGARQVGSPDSVIYLNITNLGKLQAHFSFTFPFDTMIDVDRWAQHQAPRNPNEEKELSIIQNKLFDIEPKKVKLEPEENCVIRMTYKHEVI